MKTITLDKVELIYYWIIVFRKSRQSQKRIKLLQNWFQPIVHQTATQCCISIGTPNFWREIMVRVEPVLIDSKAAENWRKRRYPSLPVVLPCQVSTGSTLVDIVKFKTHCPSGSYRQQIRNVRRQKKENEMKKIWTFMQSICLLCTAARALLSAISWCVCCCSSCLVDVLT